ncbi:MAG: VOC family protein [Chloroflexales bacterium]|nr:VOC family protein [Chloroflexales bacterium]
MPRIVHFEISVDDPERAMEFYTKVFGWEFNKWDNEDQDYWLVKTGESDQPGIDGGMFRRGGPVSYVNVLDVASLDATIAQIIANGGEIVVPKMTVPGIGYLVYFKDTEGNVFGAMQGDPSAA